MRVKHFSLLAALLCAVSRALAQTPPIPIPFDLPEPGFVTLIIENPDGTRVRNLISETPFPAGHNVASWDGLDDTGRDTDAAKHSVYSVPGKIVEPGRYRVRGLVRPAIDIRYLMTPYSNGHPAWHTSDRSSMWLANHTPPSAVLCLPAGAAPQRINAASTQPVGAGPQVLVSSYVTEGGSGLVWLDPDGHKIFGQTWLGGVWTAASQLARDRGPAPVPNVYAYAAAFWPGDKYNKNIPEIRLNELVNGNKAKGPSDERLGSGDDRPVLTPNYRLPTAPSGSDNVDLAKAKLTGMRGMAVRNGIVVLALGSLDRLAFIDAKQKAVIGLAKLADPRGLEFDSKGNLLALSGNTLLRFDPPVMPADGKFDATSNEPNVQMSSPQSITAKLDEPQQIAIDSVGNIYVSEWGASHDVKVFDSNGKLLRTIGKPGTPSVGPYDPTRMSHPNGISVDDQNRLWVAETDKAPKRVSIWNAADGSLIKAMYGPEQYGGGGTIDPVDPTRFFYVDEGGGQELSLDYAHQTARVVSVYFRADTTDFPIRGRYVDAGRETPIHFHDQLYLTDCFNTSATSGVRAASIWKLDNGIARPVAAAGDIRDAAGVLFPIFQTASLASRLPAGTELDKDNVLFAWSDLNGDGKVEAEETTFFKPPHETIRGQTLVDGVTVQNDLSFAIAMVGDQAIALHPQGFTAAGVPLFDANKQGTIATQVNRPASSGGNQLVIGAGGWNVLTTPPLPLSAYGLGGVRDGKPMWSYPSIWPGLHASHISPLASEPGEMIGTTRLLGPSFKIAGSDLGELWAINGNKGQVYVFTTDGLFVASLFRDARDAKPWPNVATAGADLTNVSLAEEDFFPSITATNDGRLLLQVSGEGNIVQVNGLDHAHRLVDSQITVTKDQLIAAQQQRLEAESKRQAEQGGGPYTIPIETTSATVDGKLDEWSKAKWLLIDRRQVQVGNWGRRTTKTEAALSVSGDRLFGAVKADDPALLSNSGEAMQNIFKTGGAIDLMLGTDPAAPDDRKSAAPGDRRLVITRVGKKTMAVLFEQTKKDYTGPTVEFASPLRSIRFAMVKDVSTSVELASTAETDAKSGVVSGMYEFSIPLSVLGLKAHPAMRIRGDIGVLRGNAFTTVQRCYWANKASGLVSDVPSEAELQPALWGHFQFGN